MEPPSKPDESDCCGTGCNPCIFDVYEEQLRRYLRNEPISVAPHENYLSPTKHSPFTLTDIRRHTADTYLLTFSAPSRISYRPGQHLMVRGEDSNGRTFSRPYTPIPLTGNPCEFTALVRVYERGTMSRTLTNSPPGATWHWRGPYGEFAVDVRRSHLLCVAQGTGIAPVYAVVDALLRDDECETFVKLFFCCRNADDILLRERLYELGARWNFTCEVFCGDGGDCEAKYNEVVRFRRVSREDLRGYLSGKVAQVLICGSEAFGRCIKRDVEDLGVTADDIFVF